MSRTDLNVSRWLEAYSERHSGITTFPGNVVLADVAGDGVHDLVMTDAKFETGARSKMRVYRGTSARDVPLPDVANSIIAFYTDQLEPRVPAVAVACGSNLYIHKNNKPYFKFQLPSIPITKAESDSWKTFIDNKGSSSENLDQLVQELNSISYDSLSSRSQELLTLPKQRLLEFSKKVSDPKDLEKFSSITCMTTLKKNSQDTHDVSCPVLATESGNIYILDPQTFNVLHQANVSVTKSTPFIVKATGIFSVDFRIVIACREGNICLLRRGWLEGKTVIQLIQKVVDFVLAPADNLIITATMDKTLSCYTKKGNKTWSMTLSHPISCLCLVTLQHLNTTLIAVGLKNGLIQLYHNKRCVDQTMVPDPPSVIVFGQMGQEEHVLIIITIAGTLIFRILKRTADFGLNTTDSVPQLQTKPLPLPKRSKMFMEQNTRERQNALEIHQSFQQDLVRLRLSSARELVQKNCMQSDVMYQKDQIKLSARVLGLGPKFTVIFTLENMETTKAVKGVDMVLHVDPMIYQCSTNQIRVPLLQANFSYRMKVNIEEIIQDLLALPSPQQNNVIRVFVMKKSQIQPVLAAVINMPATEYLYL